MCNFFFIEIVANNTDMFGVGEMEFWGHVDDK